VSTGNPGPSGPGEVKSTAALDLTSLRLDGQDARSTYADIFNAVESITMRETITGASTVDVALNDPTRALLRSALLSSRATMILDGAGFELAKVSKQGTGLSLTFEDMAVAALRRKTGTKVVAAGAMSRAQFCAGLCREVPWVKVAAAQGPKALVQLARGLTTTTAAATSDVAGGWGNYGLNSVAPAIKAVTQTVLSTASKALTKPQTAKDLEDSWTAMGRIVGEIGWRVFARRGVVYIVPDAWLLAHPPAAYTLSESSPGVDLIDVDWDVGKPAATATITAWAGVGDLFPGSAVTLTGMGVANGSWLVETVERTAASKRVTVTAIRPQPTFTEPQDTDAAGSGSTGEGGWGIPVDTGTGAAAPSESGIAEKFVQAALTSKGRPYVWGASGPSSWDCSGLVQWAARKCGVSFPKPVSSQLARCQWITVQQAIATRGALLIRGQNGHIAISLGNGMTIEARGKAYGCGSWSARGRSWTTGGVIPGIPVAAKTTSDGKGF
jgi:cell wall-associated NlpC family hydrolase